MDGCFVDRDEQGGPLIENLIAPMAASRHIFWEHRSTEEPTVWNCTCSLDAWADPATVDTMREIFPQFVSNDPRYPAGYEHRKAWESAKTLMAMRHFGALSPEAFVLSVGAGHEELVFHMTNLARWVFATDIYGVGVFDSDEADAGMLIDPSRFAYQPWRPGRLVVQHMDATSLRFEDESFDVTYSLSSIEHMGGIEGATRALDEMARVTRCGGLIAVATEAVVNDAPTFATPDLSLFAAEDLEKLAANVAHAELVEPLTLAVTDRDYAAMVTLEYAIGESSEGRETFPHVLLEYEQRCYTSLMMFFRRT
jgi:SAM-dependent methyltransferase